MGLPTIYLIDADGKIRGYVSGVRTWDSLVSKNTLRSLKDGGSLAELTTEKLSIRVENDTNFDGGVDRWETFDSSGKLIRIESDRNFDGKPDLVQNK